MITDYPDESDEHEKKRNLYKDRLRTLLNRNAGYFTVNELIILFSINNDRHRLTSREMKIIDDIDFLSRNRNLGES